MTLLRVLAWLIILLLVGGLLWIRFAPDDVARWNVDPATIAPRQNSGWAVRPEGGDARFVASDVAPEALLRAFDDVARTAPRTERLTGNPADGRITYVSRSRVMGFPDYTTVTAVPEGDGAALILAARQRYGSQDFGVNRDRVQIWLDALRERLGQGAGQG